MKWKIKNKDYKYCNWYKWFAWYPVRVGDGKVWLEFVYRRQIGYTQYHWIDRLFGTPEYEYKETIFDIIRNSDVEEVQN